MRTLRRAMAASLLGLLAACGSSQTGKVSVRLMDASGDVKAAVVTIAEIDLVGSGGTTVLSTTETTTDLLTLANDTALLVDGVDVPAGTYSQLRFVITGGYVEVEQADGSSIIYASSPDYAGLPTEAVVGGKLQMPSYAQSGLKVDLPGGLVVGAKARIVLVDFNVQQSFGHVAGHSGMWVMHPVATATDFELTGTVNVTLTPAASPPVTIPAGATFRATLTFPDGTTTKSLPLAADAGAYKASFAYLVPGDYTIAFGATSTTATTPPATIAYACTTSPSTSPPATVAVASGQATAADFDLTALTAK